MLAQVETLEGIKPSFVAGLVLEQNVVTEAAPIIRYMIGWNRDRVRNYAKKRGWIVRVVKA